MYKLLSLLPDILNFLNLDKIKKQVVHILLCIKPLKSKSERNALRKECVSVFKILTEPLVRRSGSFVYPGALGGSGVCFVLRDDWPWSSFISLQPSCL